MLFSWKILTQFSREIVVNWGWGLASRGQGRICFQVHLAGDWQILVPYYMNHSTGRPHDVATGFPTVSAPGGSEKTPNGRQSLSSLISEVTTFQFHHTHYKWVRQSWLHSRTGRIMSGVGGYLGLFRGFDHNVQSFLLLPHSSFPLKWNLNLIFISPEVKSRSNYLFPFWCICKFSAFHRWVIFFLTITVFHLLKLKYYLSIKLTYLS